MHSIVELTYVRCLASRNGQSLAVAGLKRHLIAVYLVLGKCSIPRPKVIYF
jgi:hypothetical protein